MKKKNESPQIKKLRKAIKKRIKRIRKDQLKMAQVPTPKLNGSMSSQIFNLAAQAALPLSILGNAGITSGSNSSDTTNFEHDNPENCPFAIGEKVVIARKIQKTHNWKIGREAIVKNCRMGHWYQGGAQIMQWQLDIEVPDSEAKPSGTIWAHDVDKMGPPPKPKIPLMEHLILPSGYMEAINEALSQLEPDNKNKILNTWGFGEILEKGLGVTMLFYGAPGTGKTMAAQAIAEKLGKRLMIIGSAEIQSSEPGGAERAIKQYFAEAKKNQCVILLDECDSLIYDRSKVGMILAAEINCLLGEIERFEGVAIFTTNNTPVLDKAMERRIALKLEFPMPDKAHRLKIWKSMFRKPDMLEENVDLEEFASYKMAGGHIKNIALNAARRACFLKKDKIGQEDIEIAFKRESEGFAAFQKVGRHQVISEEISIGPDMGLDITKTNDQEKGN